MVLGFHEIRTTISENDFIYIYVYVYVYLCVCVCVCVCMYAYMYIYIFVYVCVYVCVCICVYVYVYIHIYYIYIIFVFTFIALCISYLILFTLRHIPLPLFRKCIWSHANIWDGASFCNSLQSLAIVCICRELNLGFLHWFCMRFWLFCFKRGPWFVNAVVEGLIQQ